MRLVNGPPPSRPQQLYLLCLRDRQAQRLYAKASGFDAAAVRSSLDQKRLRLTFAKTSVITTTWSTGRKLIVRTLYGWYYESHRV